MTLARCCTALSTAQDSFCLIFTSHISSNAYGCASPTISCMANVGNRVSCSAIKVLGKKPAKQRFGRLSGTKELDGVVEGTGRKGKYLVRINEVGVSMALSARSLKCQVIDASSSGSTSVHPPPSISEEAASPAVGLTEQHEQEVDDSDNALLCHGVQWKVVDGVLEDWRCMASFGAHILWGNYVM